MVLSIAAVARAVVGLLGSFIYQYLLPVPE
jgi:hypothetical protein